jgi:hypothetical protein
MTTEPRSMTLTLARVPAVQRAGERSAALLGSGGRELSQQRRELARCVLLQPAEALAAAGAVLDAATRSECVGVMVVARTRLCQAALALGHVSEAVRHARPLAPLANGESCDDLYRGEVWLAAHQALAQADPQAAAQLLVKVMNWLHETCRHHVPEPFHDSFLQRNPVNRALLALAARAREAGAGAAAAPD